MYAIKSYVFTQAECTEGAVIYIAMIFKFVQFVHWTASLFIKLRYKLIKHLLWTTMWRKTMMFGSVIMQQTACDRWSNRVARSLGERTP